MRERWLIHGILTCAVVLGSVQLAHAQSGGGGGGGGGTSGGTGSSSGGIGAGAGGIGASSGGVGATSGSGTGMGIATLGSSSNLGAGLGGGGGGGSASGSSATIPATADPFRTTYNNPYATGLTNVSTSFSTTKTGSSSVTGKGFGQPTYAAAKTTTMGQGGTTTTTVNGGGFSTLNMPKAPPYITVLADNVPLVIPPAAQLQGSLLNSLSGSPFLKDTKGIFVAVDGSTVFLKGQVASQRERTHVEGIVRLTPGVRNVVNELIAPAPTPKQ